MKTPKSNLKTFYNALLSVFQKHSKDVLFAYLFGSSVSCQTHPTSDVDIAVYFSENDKPLNYDKMLLLHADLCRTLKRNDIDILILNIAKNIILLDDIVRHGVLIYDREPDVREAFEIKVLHQAIDFRQQRLI
ncbi:MAG: nucleotidyltransferase domain-containing protein, partial [Thermodesulfovibrionales bacterium]|nr:nucleotidyltransferase domain-containing protein [Thermodesulfovibrionales bacterium]